MSFVKTQTSKDHSSSVYVMADEAARTARTEKRKAMPLTQLSMAHTCGCIVLPDREHLLDRLPKNAIAAELGVTDGEFSAEILKRARPSKLHLIDTWPDEAAACNLVKLKKRFESKISENKIVVHQGNLSERFSEFPENYFDWVYIDTSHSYEKTLEELQIANRCVRPSGRIAGHDFCTGNIVTPVVYGVIQAVNQFCKDECWRYEYLTLESHGHFSFCITRC